MYASDARERTKLANESKPLEEYKVLEMHIRKGADIGHSTAYTIYHIGKDNGMMACIPIRYKENIEKLKERGFTVEPATKWEDVKRKTLWGTTFAYKEVPMQGHYTIAWGN